MQKKNITLMAAFSRLKYRPLLIESTFVQEQVINKKKSVSQLALHITLCFDKNNSDVNEFNNTNKIKS